MGNSCKLSRTLAIRMLSEVQSSHHQHVLSTFVFTGRGMYLFPKCFAVCSESGDYVASKHSVMSRLRAQDQLMVMDASVVLDLAALPDS